MGMYTGIRVKVTVKEEFRQMIKEIHEGASWSDFVSEFSFLCSYSQLARAEFIPSGVLCYMPNHWEEGKFPNQTATDGFDRKINMETGYWTFQCSLKNYNSEIEQFFDEVLSEIISEAEHIECRYEEDEESTFYEFINGKNSVNPTYEQEE